MIVIHRPGRPLPELFSNLQNEKVGILTGDIIVYFDVANSKRGKALNYTQYTILKDPDTLWILRWFPWPRWGNKYILRRVDHARIWVENYRPPGSLRGLRYPLKHGLHMIREQHDSVNMLTEEK